MPLPALAPYPSRGPKHLAPSEWSSIVELWTTLVDLYLELPEDEFVTSHEGIHAFLTSYLAENAESHLQRSRASAEPALHKAVFLLLHRVLRMQKAPEWSLNWSLLTNALLVFPRSQTLRQLLLALWQRNTEALEATVQRAKSEGLHGSDVQRLSRFMSTPMVSALVLTDADFLDAVIESSRKDAMLLLYRGFLSLAQPDHAKYSLLADTIYGFRSNERYRSLLNDVCAQTRLLEELEPLLDRPDAARANNLLQDQSTRIKGKGLASDALTQLQDMFPDLGPSVAERVLNEHNGNVEGATVALLEGPAPSTDLPIRRNVFDNDEFDRLAIASSALRMNRPEQTADDLLDSTDRSAQKQAIFSALAAFDSDEDERDDTYDVADVGGTVDMTEALESEKDEETLFKVWQVNPAIFLRDASTRRSKERHALRVDTGWTDEAIEGWAIMLGRDSRKRQQLEDRFAFVGQQQALPSTAYRREDGEDGPSTSTSRGRGRGRGYRRGNASGAPSDQNTQVERQRKEAHKGSRANHNRRDQRAKKMARGGVGA